MIHQTSRARFLDISLVATVDQRLDPLAQVTVPVSLHCARPERTSDVGYHVTLFEFATHRRLSEDTFEHSLHQAQELFQLLAERVGRVVGMMPSPTFLTIGTLLSPGSLALALQPDRRSRAVVGQIGAACTASAPSSKFLNRMASPEPLHCTVLRGLRTGNMRSDEPLQRFRRELETACPRLPTNGVLLTLACREPYNDVTAVNLTPRGASP